VWVEAAKRAMFKFKESELVVPSETKGLLRRRVATGLFECCSGCLIVAIPALVLAFLVGAIYTTMAAVVLAGPFSRDNRLAAPILQFPDDGSSSLPPADFSTLMSVWAFQSFSFSGANITVSVVAPSPPPSSPPSPPNIVVSVDGSSADPLDPDVQLELWVDTPTTLTFAGNHALVEGDLAWFEPDSVYPNVDDCVGSIVPTATQSKGGPVDANGQISVTLPTGGIYVLCVRQDVSNPSFGIVEHQHVATVVSFSPPSLCAQFRSINPR
jgi:hypothetical protein